MSSKYEDDKERPNYLTLEHSPPQKLGGKAEILTCYSCNHLNGRIDKQFSRHLKIKSFMHRDVGVNVPIRLIIDNKDYNVTAETTDKGVLWFKFPEGFKIDELRHSLDKSKSFNFQIESAKTIHLRISLLRAAYLKAFTMFGYDFIMHSSFNIIRQQLMQPDEMLLPSYGNGITIEGGE